MNFKILGMILYALSFVYSLFLQAVKYRSKNNPIPENVGDIYDAESYKKWRDYHRETSLADLVSSIVSFVIYLLLFVFDILPKFDIGGNPYLSSACLLLFVLTLDSLTGAVFAYIYSMKIDEKYGFNRMTIKTFVADQIKGWLIQTVVMIALTLLFALLYENMGDWILLLFSAVMIAVVFAMIFLAPYFSKIFNKFTPLGEGELRDKLTALLEKNGYKVREIQVMDASRRTTKSNAYFSGLGRSKTIVLYDTLISSMTPDEIVAVFAHELGHGLHKDTFKNSFIGILQMVVIILLTWLTVRTAAIYPDFGFAGRNYGFAFVLVMVIEMPVLMPLFSLFASFVSRSAEYRADRHAVEEGYGKELISGLKKLAKDNLSDLSPSRIEVALTYSHPPLSLRIEAIERDMGERGAPTKES